MSFRDNEADAELLQFRRFVGEMTLNGTVAIEQVADRLGVSPRTLQRRLMRHGVTYRMVVDDARLEIARVMLRTTDSPVQHISQTLGYRTAGSFARAFTRWTGQSPREFRKATHQADPR